MTQTFPLVSAGVRDIARAVRAGDVSPAEVADAVLARMDATEGLVHAFSQVREAEVRAHAAELTSEAAAGRLRGPLHGVPVAVKEWFDVRGFPTLLHGPDAPPAREDATAVARLRAAGALVVGKTHVPLRGTLPPTRNPWNLAHTAGGSSSGSGAAVAARVVPLALGEQTGGSNLRPAAYCGVGAIKPTYGAISRFGLFPGSWSRDHPGLIGLDMHDISLAFSVVAGHDPRDPTSIERPAPPADLRLGQASPPRLGVVGNFFPQHTGPEMTAAIERAAGALRHEGAAVDEVALPREFGLVWDATEIVRAEQISFYTGNAQAAAAVGEVGAAGAAVRRSSWRAAELLPATYYLQARRIRAWLSRTVEALMREHRIDALLLAAAPADAPPLEESTGNSVLLSPWSFLGWPAITINAGLSSRGLPLGAQLVAPPRRDHDLLRTGAWCERALPPLPVPAGFA